MFVVMTDTFLSGWGHAKGKLNKYVIECDTEDEARRAEAAANRRHEMVDVMVCDKVPYYPESTHLVTHIHYDDLGSIWKGDPNEED